MKIWAPGIAFCLAGCLNGPGFFKQDAATKTNAVTDANAPVKTVTTADTVTASLSSASTKTQLVGAPPASAIAAASVSFGPGTLAIDTDVTLEEGSPLVSGVLGDELGLGADNSVAAAGSPVVISSSVLQDAQRPFVVSLGVDDGALGLTGLDLDRLVIAYKVFVAAENKTIVGMIPRSEITFKDGRASFEIQYFGVYQPALAEKPIEKRLAVAASSPILTKRADAAAAQPVWSAALASYDSAKQTVSCTAELSNANAKACSVQVDRDKQARYDYRASTAGGTTTGAVALTLTDAGTFFCRIECSDDLGRTSAAAWSDAIAVVAQAQATVPTTTTPSPLIFNGFTPNPSGVPTANFSTDLDFSAIPASLLTLRDDTVGRDLPGTISGTNNTLQFSQAKELPLGSSLTLRLNGNLTGKQGQSASFSNQTQVFPTQPGVWSDNNNLSPDYDSAFPYQMAQNGGTTAFVHLGDSNLLVTLRRAGQFYQPFHAAFDELAQAEDTVEADKTWVGAGPQGDVALAYVTSSGLKMRYFTAQSGTWSKLLAYNDNGKLRGPGVVTVNAQGAATVFFKYGATTSVLNLVYLNFNSTSVSGFIQTPLVTGVAIQMPSNTGDGDLTIRTNESGDVAGIYRNASYNLVPFYLRREADGSLAAINVSTTATSSVAASGIGLAIGERPNPTTPGHAFAVLKGSGSFQAQFFDGSAQVWSAAANQVTGTVSPINLVGVYWRGSSAFDVAFTDYVASSTNYSLFVLPNAGATVRSAFRATVATGVCPLHVRGASAKSIGGSAATEVGFVFAQCDSGKERMGASFDFGGGWSPVVNFGPSQYPRDSQQTSTSELGFALTGTGRAVMAWRDDASGAATLKLSGARVAFDPATGTAGAVSTIEQLQLATSPGELKIVALDASSGGRAALLYVKDGSGPQARLLNTQTAPVPIAPIVTP